MPDTPSGAVGIQENFGTGDGGSDTTKGNSFIPLEFALRNKIDRKGDQDWFRVYLFSGKTYQVDLEGSPTGQGNLGDPLLRILQVPAPDQDPELACSADDGGVGRNARLVFSPPAEEFCFSSRPRAPARPRAPIGFWYARAIPTAGSPATADLGGG